VRVARAAGVQQGHLTYYFPKKTDLVRAVLERVHDKTRREFAQLIDKAKAQAAQLPREELLDLFFERVHALLRDRKRTRVMIALAVEAQDDSEVAASIDEQARMQENALAFLLGRQPGDVDVLIALAALRGMGIASVARAGGPRQVDAVLVRLRQLLAGSARSD
jgi:AcrR family transcriptional regulator